MDISPDKSSLSFAVIGLLIGSMAVYALYGGQAAQPSVRYVTIQLPVTETFTASPHTTQEKKWLSGEAGVVGYLTAVNYLGKIKTVQGPAGVRNSRTSITIYISLGIGTGFLIIILHEDWGNFKCVPDAFYKNVEVRATGLIESYQGIPAIRVSFPNQIEVAFSGFPCQ